MLEFCEVLPNPRSRRVLADLAHACSGRNLGTQGKVALAIGAGVDIALAGRRGWADFVSSLAQFGRLSNDDKGALELLSPTLPAETADALRVALGRSKYEEGLRRNTCQCDLTPGELGPALQLLVNCGIRLILNFNYTRDLLETLSESSPLEIIAIQRFHLEGWTKRDLLEPRDGEIHHISIHGMADYRFGHLPSVVLDRNSYNQAFFGDLHYGDLLTRVLQDYTLLSVGLSWDDVVLRSAAARVHFTTPICGRVHVALIPATTAPKASRRKARTHGRMYVWRERAFVTAYSIRTIHYSPHDGHRDLPIILRNVSTLSRRIRDALNGDSLTVPELGVAGRWVRVQEISDVLDECGDYESLFHREWFAKDGNWRKLHALITSGSMRPSSLQEWIILARIERHLRHFIWVYAHPDKRDASRVDAWEKIAQYWGAFDNPERRSWRSGFEEAAGDDEVSSVSMRGLFEFALGAFEVYGQSRMPCSEACHDWQQWLISLATQNKSCKVAKRIEIGRGIWTIQKPRLSTLAKLRRSAITSAWEGIEAKIALDICEHHFEKRIPRRPLKGWGIKLRSHPERDVLTRFATDAWETARMAGCGRRELGAIALASLVVPPEQAEANLVGVLHAVSKRVEAGAGPVGDWGIYTGLLATLLDRSQRTTEPRAALAWLEERCGKIRAETLRGTDVPTALARYWQAYRPDAAELAEQVATVISGS
jgi:hypothetical protein